MSNFVNYLLRQFLIILFFTCIGEVLKEYYILTYLCTVIAFIVFVFCICLYNLGIYL